ncbi:cation:proton antiporter [Methanoculleus sp. FWC-SCC3]|uniref:Cation:proton antiporter n=1 Tax=Methanoculleus methanifontis TaxID=2584086 RepID=A0ABT8M5A7_9EURY|nr:MnhB domain-containing protein [Methanoculleus sp. FWC-SCC3]MDN7013784.1 cation:proton antiporter [Methanoculleus sp. FWC-SCC3]
MRENVVIRTVSRIAVPFIQVFALYVIVHGALGAGGGFQGGVVFAASFILMTVAFGLTSVRKRLSNKWIVVYSVLGITIYAGIGLLCLLMGGNYLEYGVIETILGIPHLHGYLLDAVEIGIGITVMAVMTSIICDMADKGGESS